MLQTAVKYIVGLSLLAFIGYHSVYVEKLSERKQALSADQFDAASFAKELWNSKVPQRLDSAVLLNNFVSAVTDNTEAAFDKYSQSLSLGNFRYVLVKATALVSQINEDDVIIDINSDRGLIRAKVATEFIYGNAIRDALNVVSLSDFDEADPLNQLAMELNQISRKQVVPAFRQAVQVGDHIEVFGAIEFHKKYVDLRNIEIFPVKIIVLP